VTVMNPHAKNNVVIEANAAPWPSLLVVMDPPTDGFHGSPAFCISDQRLMTPRSS
jgi:hypothetical protein